MINHKGFVMKRVVIIALLATAAWSTDYTQMSTQELMQLRGTLSPSERAAFKAEMQKRMQTMSPAQRQQMMQGRGMGKGMGQKQQMMQGRGMGKGTGQGQKGMQNRSSYADFDLNHDGKITQKEFYDAQATRMAQKSSEGKLMKNAANAPTFENIDSNGDGIVSKTEFNAHQMQMMQSKRGQGRQN